MKEMEVLTMTRTELKVALKLHHDWKVNYRRDYARLLLVYTEGKILSMFEAAISEQVKAFHEYHFYDYEIEWQEVYRDAAYLMHVLAEEKTHAKV